MEDASFWPVLSALRSDLQESCESASRQTPPKWRDFTIFAPIHLAAALRTERELLNINLPIIAGAALDVIITAFFVV